MDIRSLLKKSEISKEEYKLNTISGICFILLSVINLIDLILWQNFLGLINIIAFTGTGIALLLKLEKRIIIATIAIQALRSIIEAIVYHSWLVSIMLLILYCIFFFVYFKKIPLLPSSACIVYFIPSIIFFINIFYHYFSWLELDIEFVLKIYIERNYLIEQLLLFIGLALLIRIMMPIKEVNSLTSYKIGKFSIGMIVFSLILSLGICIISKSVYGRVYYFDGYGTTKALWIIAIICLIVGSCFSPFVLLYRNFDSSNIREEDVENINLGVKEFIAKISSEKNAIAESIDICKKTAVKDEVYEKFISGGVLVYTQYGGIIRLGNELMILTSTPVEKTRLSNPETSLDHSIYLLKNNKDNQKEKELKKQILENLNLYKTYKSAIERQSHIPGYNIISMSKVEYFEIVDESTIFNSTIGQKKPSALGTAVNEVIWGTAYATAKAVNNANNTNNVIKFEHINANIYFNFETGISPIKVCDKMNVNQLIRMMPEKRRN